MDSEQSGGGTPAGAGRPALRARCAGRLERSRYLLRVGDEIERVVLEADLTREEAAELLRGLLREWADEDEGELT